MGEGVGFADGQALLRAGADVHARNTENITAVHTAASKGFAQVGFKNKPRMPEILQLGSLLS